MATFNLPRRNINATPQLFGPFTLPSKLATQRFVSIVLDSISWATNPGRRLLVTIEESFDGGLTWRTFSEDTFTKGLLSRSGAMPSMAFRDDNGFGISPARQVRITLAAPDGTVNVGFTGTF